MLEQKFDHEEKPIKVGATFSKKDSIDKAVNDIIQEVDVSLSQVEIISPQDQPSQLGKKLEPEQKAIGKDLLRSHFWFCVYGAIIGFCLSLLLYAFNIPTIDSSAGVISIAL